MVSNIDAPHSIFERSDVPILHQKCMKLVPPNRLEFFQGNNTANNHRGTTDTVDLTATAQSTIIQSNKVNITAIKMTKHDG